MGGLDTVGSAYGYGAQGAGYGGQGAMFGQQAAGMGSMYEQMATDPIFDASLYVALHAKRG
jgi:hypothetical protein